MALTHLDDTGAARMVDVSDKSVSRRRAVAIARVSMQPNTLALIASGQIGKGDVYAVCRIAGIQAAKRTWELIPLCHLLPLESVRVNLEALPEECCVEIRAEVVLVGKTGVEMEALTAVSVAALTLYDMCKAVDRGIEIQNVRLLEKSGGRSGTWSNAATAAPVSLDAERRD